MQSVLWYPGTSLETVERQIIHEALAFYKGNKVATAQSLGIAVRTLDNKIEKYAVDQKTAEDKKAQAEKERSDWSLRHRGLLAPVSGVTTPKPTPEQLAAPGYQGTVAKPVVDPQSAVAAAIPDLRLEPQKDGELDDLIGAPETVVVKSQTMAMPPTPTQRNVPQGVNRHQRTGGR